ncbi:ABC transporter, ATP-binding protein [Rhodopirellula maiorica SM1]|uniref:ABC transporter, ATP-binding protein n=1 Tax=Rhodopirellula maiorica SM1 TaxID=1265738 RepID=M5RUL4_9BACT|nr:ABC transporter ATP-binding protein [Rhodopirellula maiorica]EMI17659.1 ABC transporter, ATP-binding protein [Rhodopirellula maiorica SM1]
MKSDLAIHAEGIGKQYRIGAQQKSYSTLRESLMNVSASAINTVRGGLKELRQRRESNSFWALKDISFEVKQGDVVGIVGSNGAGKSTLLKVLSRITDPTLGYVDLRGRVGSLLEVGTGFHPELTGRENIFLNGAILGMPRSVVKKQFDAIVDFAGVERFVDTPVKRYSSGMYLRLAFAVAAHLEPEILLVDEVLAVGDASFQKKCLGKMDSVAKEGRTVLFVSHNMAAIRSLCNKGIMLRNGRVAEQGDVQTVIQSYFKDLGVLDSDKGDSGYQRNERSIFGRVELNDGSSNSVSQSTDLTFSTVMSIPRPVGGFRLLLLLSDMKSQQLMALCNTSAEMGLGQIEPGDYRVSVQMPPLWLNPGMYSVCFKLYLEGESESAKHFSDAFPLDIYGESSPVDAVVNPRSDWTVEFNVTTEGSQLKRIANPISTS